MSAKAESGEQCGAPSAAPKRARDGERSQELSKAKWQAVDYDRAHGACGSADGGSDAVRADDGTRHPGVGASEKAGQTSSCHDRVSFVNVHCGKKKFLGVPGQGVGQEEKPPPHPFAP